MSLLKDFKAFAVKGNVIDLAVAVIIGGAFSGIVKSLVDDVIMPVVGRILAALIFPICICRWPRCRPTWPPHWLL